MITSKDKNAENPVREKPKELKTSLFGSVKGGDVTEKMMILINGVVICPKVIWKKISL